MTDFKNISDLPEIKEYAICRIINASGVLGCCNEHRNPMSLYENCKTKDGKHIQIFPAREEVSTESWVGHSHMFDVEPKWRYTPEFDNSPL